ncbi:trypsin-like peptidase domain-containing protein [Archangium violaceum]|uniref:trypsin-like peptidase domain-containing protein n=1 Tax=Archangium violaceum TaxID=83451 RepID=UPI00193BAF68|nr:trypsin-like peptidase domain-containing protein [Archangium violaceum]QRK04849.1 trypsin-like peptidase domain-containing protein [Archangium violaceum]
MSQSMEVRCLRCGRPEDGEGVRCRCGASLLVDVVLKERNPEERRSFQLARALAPLGPPVPPFAELRKELERADGRVVRGVSRVFAQRVVEALATQGATAELRPSKSTGGMPGWVPAVIGGAALIGVGVGAVMATRKAPVPETPAATVEATAVPDAGTEAEAPPKMLTTQEISRLSLPSTVSLRCEGSTGAGFFVGEELVLTNAHVACPVGTVMEVTLSDGRRVLGQTLERDEDLDLATVRVSGARAEPLPLGDATELSPGDRLVFIGSPKGLSFTVHEGKVSHLGREYLGVGYVQFDASVNPGNSGGPLINGRGEVVGVVSLKVTNAEGIGLALPIQYAEKMVSVPATPESEQRWAALQEKVAQEEERGLRQFRLEPYTPALLGLEESTSVGLVVFLAERFPQAPSRMNHRFELQSDAGTCAMEVSFERWKPLMDAAKDEDNTRRLRWLASKGLTEHLYVGAARLPVESCPRTGTGQGWLTVVKGSPEVSRTKLKLEQVEKAREVWKAREAERRFFSGRGLRSLNNEPAGGSAYDRQAEQSWRSAFQGAQNDILRLEAERRRYAQEDAVGHNVRSTLDDIDRRLKRARERLADLERKASNAGVPREWRQ